MIAGGIRWRHFHETEGRQGVEAFFHGEVQGTPAGGQILDDLIGEHDDQLWARVRPGEEDGAHFEVRGFAGTKRAPDRCQIFVAVMDNLFGCLRWRQISFQHIAAIEFGCCCLRVLIDSHVRERSPKVSSTQSAMRSVLARATALSNTLGMGARMVCEVLVLLGNLGLEHGQLRLPGVPDFLGTHGITSEHVAEALIREHLGQLLIKEVHSKGPLFQQFFNLGFRNGGNVM